MTNPSLSVGTLSALLGGVEVGTRSKRMATYRGINYDGEMCATIDWIDELGGQLPFDTHFRLVFVLRDDTAVTQDSLEDDRTLVFLPGSLSAENRDAMTDVLALNQMQEDYRHRQDDEALRVKQFIDSRHSDSLIALLMAQRDFYKRGRIISQLDIPMSSDDVLSPGQDFLGRIVTSLFDALFVDRPIGTFRRNRSMNLNTETSRVFTGLWEREPERSVRNALENFAVGLGLAQQDDPLKYDPADCGAFEIIKNMFNGARDEETGLQVAQIYEQLARVGIPARLATLYLLCFVRSNTDVELLLKSGHSIRMNGGRQLLGERLYSSVIPRLEWNNRAFATPSYFDVLAERKGLVWNDCLEWTRKFAPDLETATDPDRVEQQTRQFINSLESERERLQNAMGQIRSIEPLLTGDVPSNMWASAELVQSLTLSSSFEEFMMKVDSANLASSDDLGQAVTDAHNFYQLGQMAVEIISAYTYLNNVPLDGRDGAPGRIGEGRITLIGDINLGTLAVMPNQWSRIKERFDTWKRVYIREYRKLHRDYHVEISKTRQRFSEMSQKLVAIESIEQIEQFALANNSERLKSQVQSMLDGLEECDPNIEADDLEAIPHCTRCGVRMGNAPMHDPSPIEGQINETLEEIISALRSDAVIKVMAASESPIVRALFESLKGSDTTRVFNALKDKGTVDLLRGILEGGGANLVFVRDIGIVGELSKEFPTVSRDSIQEVVERFRDLIEEALNAQQEYAGPGVKVEVRLQ